MTSKKTETEYTECILASGKMEIINKKNLIGFCHYSLHRGFITRAVLKTHNCDGKGCHYLEKFEEHPFWIERKRQKDRKKDRKIIAKNAARNKEKKEEAYKTIAIQLSKKFRYSMEIISVRKDANEDKFIVFYISPNPFDDKSYFSMLEKELEKNINRPVELRHIKEADGSYAILE